ncbi:MAG: HAMP domain-containing histidine kinase [Firmicutes bacterium]|nr:HAMP domain-containing histidine kinase [Bacillota bacterium]
MDINTKNKQLIILILTVLSLFLFIHISLSSFIKDFPIASKGSLLIENMNTDFIPIEGEFKVYDGLKNSTNIESINNKVKHMTLDQIRVYSYPKGTATINMTIENINSDIDGLLIEELYTANRVYINNKLVASSGIVGGSRQSTLKEKNSILIPLNVNENTIDLTIEIANHELISGQFEKNIYIGDFDKLSYFNNHRLALKYFGLTFYLSVSVFLYGLFRKNKKYIHHLTLSIAGFFNFYAILIHFEPMAIFKVKGTIYLINSYFSTFPTLFSQFFSAMTVILFFKHGWIYTNRKKFMINNCLVFLLVILIIIIFDDIANPIYIMTLIYILGLIVYTLIVLGKKYIDNIEWSYRIFTGLTIYILSYSYYVYLTLNINPYNTANFYNIYMVLGQAIFYLVISYASITKFSSSFYLTEIQEEKLEQLVREKTEQLERSYTELLLQDNIRKQLLQDISHDLRSPITVVKGYAELMATHQIKDKEKDKFINIIYHKISYIGNLINELFALNGLENNKDYPMDIECISDILKNTVLSHNTDRIKSTIEEDVYLTCNEKQMYRLFNNLIDNALEHSKNNKEIIIDLKSIDRIIVITITDFGIGISDKDLPHIFDRFSRSDKSRNSDQNHFGLGLAISKAIVNNHKGIIECQSTIGKGTTFTIEFSQTIEEDTDEASNNR